MLYGFFDKRNVIISVFSCVLYKNTNAIIKKCYNIASYYGFFIVENMKKW